MTTVKILEGYRVLDLSDEKGKRCGKILTDMGAEVVSIRKPGIPVPPVYDETGKKFISLNLEKKRGQAIFQTLIKDTDILIESYPPGYLSSFKLGFTELSRVNERLIMASITDFGQSGPYCDSKSTDLIDSALGGQLMVCGEPGKPPLKPYGQQPHLTACLFAVNGILLALWNRHNSGRGQYLDISIQECVAATLDHILVRYFHQGAIARRQGSLHWNRNFRIFPCRDGYMLLSMHQHWETLVEWLDSEGMAGDLTDKRWEDEELRRREIGHIIEILEKWTLKHSADELVEQGQLMRFSWAKVAAIPEVVDNPQLNARGYFAEIVDPESGKFYKFPGAPVKMSESPWQINPQIPRIEDYNFEVYRNRLGLTEAEIDSLIKEGVI